MLAIRTLQGTKAISQEKQTLGANRILRASFWITGVNLLTSFLNFITSAALASAYGTGAEMDGVFVSQTIPVLIQAVLGTAANFAIIPVLGDLERNGNRQETARTISFFLTVFGLSLTLGALTCTLLSHSVVVLIAPGLPSGTARVAGRLLALQSPLILLSGLSAIFSSLHSARR